jgi:predicted metal-dependent hydrolase
MDEKSIEEAFEELFSERADKYNLIFKTEYSPLKEFNAYATLRFDFDKKIVVFRLSKKWQNISAMIRKGLIQSLMARLLSKKLSLKPKQTTSIEVYNNFLKNMHLSAKKTKTDSRLEESFKRVNAKYFNSLLEKPNLRFGRESYKVLANYNLQNDTVTVSRVFMEADDEILDFLMYHELLHKIIKFKGTFKRIYHTKNFRIRENWFENYEEINKRISAYVRNYAAKKHKTKNFKKRLFFSNFR